MYKNKHEKSRLIFCKPIGYVNVQTLLIYFINSCNYKTFHFNTIIYFLLIIPQFLLILENRLHHYQK